MGETNQPAPAPLALPTHQAGYAPPGDADAAAEADALVAALNKSAKDGEGFADLFHPNGFWRDGLVFTRDFRTNQGTERIAQAAKVGNCLRSR